MTKKLIKNNKTTRKKIVRIMRGLNILKLMLMVTLAILSIASPVLADDPLTAINNMSTFIFSAIKAIGLILLGFGIVQIGLSLKSHDAQQRANGFLTFFGGIIIAFAKDILDLIL